MVVGIHKGSAFELKIYKDLRDLGVCKRTIGSGSSDEPADILFKQYAIECKHVKKVTWRWLDKVWKKLNNQTSIFNNNRSYEPIIVFRQNREPIMVMCKLKYRDKTTRGIISYNIWKQIIK